MNFWYEKVVRPYFFTLDPEHAHERSVAALSLLGKVGPAVSLLESLTQLSPMKFAPVRAFGLDFPNRVGLAAGYDKHATAWPALSALGFGHAEIGTVTALPQPGNERPRLFRYPEQEAVINRMGFNNLGAEAIAARLAKQTPRGKRRIPLGINIGKSTVVPATEIDKVVEDYLVSFGLLADYADYLVLNVSCPNTPNFRTLQDEKPLRQILGAISAANRERQRKDLSARVPVLLKIAPDLPWAHLDMILQVLTDFGIDGVVATNTTTSRPGFFATVDQRGGLSGRPVRDKSTQVVGYIARATGGRLPIIGVGGIDDAASAAEKLDAGATLVQVYTGMIYRGPFLPRDIARAASWRDRRV